MKRKGLLTKWSVVCRSKDDEGFGIQDLQLQVKNDALVSKWLFKLLTGMVFGKLLRNKHLGQKVVVRLSEAWIFAFLRQCDGRTF